MLDILLSSDGLQDPHPQESWQELIPASDVVARLMHNYLIVQKE
jgi:hypothetical protein